MPLQNSSEQIAAVLGASDERSQEVLDLITEDFESACGQAGVAGRVIIADTAPLSERDLAQNELDAITDAKLLFVAQLDQGSKPALDRYTAAAHSNATPVLLAVRTSVALEEHAVTHAGDTVFGWYDINDFAKRLSLYIHD